MNATSPDWTALLAAIDEQPEPAHGDYTPAVHALVAHGLPALQHVLPLLDAPQEVTRLHAQRVFEGVLKAWVKPQVQQRAGLHRVDAALQRLWVAMGDYHWQADAALRRQAMDRWSRWLALPSHEERRAWLQDR